jgi:hypothetical protein
VYAHPVNKQDVWRTWFWDDCEQASLFGVNKKYLSRIEHYRVGTALYLEDAPLFARGGKEKHRICGPYRVEASLSLPAGCKVEKLDPQSGKPVIFLEPNPDMRGPWGDISNVRREIAGQQIVFDKKASVFSFFPYRFRICRETNWSDECALHREKCPWCG